MRTKYKKKIKNGKEYFFFRLKHESLITPKDIYGKTIKELEDKIKKETEKLNYGILKNNDTLGEYLEKWMYDIKFMNIKNTSKESYNSAYLNHIKGKPITKIKISNINKNIVQNYYNSLIRKNIGKSIFKKVHCLITQCIKYAYDNDIIIKDFSKSLIIPKNTEDEKIKKINKIKVFSRKEQEVFIKSIKGNKFELLYTLALFTGMRESELLALTWNDIDFNKATININKIVKYQKIINRENKKEYKFIVQTPKTINSIRIIPIPKSILKKLKVHRAALNELKFIYGKSYNNNDLLFCNNKGNYLSGQYVYIEFKKIINKINKDKFQINDINFHGLRHTYATRLFELKENPKTVQHLLGHSSISITMDIYTHILEDTKDETSKKLNDLYKSLT